MTQHSSGYSPPQGDSVSAPLPEVAKEEVAGIGRTAMDSGTHVAETAGEQARQVATEAGHQLRDLMNEGLEQLRGQARDGQQKAAETLRELANQLHAMADKADQHGPMADVVRQASESAGGVASWLESHEPGDVLDETRAFARRRPALFLAGAGLAGMLVGRLARGAIAHQKEEQKTGNTETALTAGHTRSQPSTPLPRSAAENLTLPPAHVEPGSSTTGCSALRPVQP
jgi:hypothetical protein